MKEYVKNVENEYKVKTSKNKENETIVQRIKELTCSTLNLQNFETWESSLARVLTMNTTEHINYLRAVEGVRILFMPHSPGIYIALVLKSADELEQDYAFKQKDTNAN